MTHGVRERSLLLGRLSKFIIMQLLASTLAALSLAQSAFAAPRPVDLLSRTTSLSSWLSTEVPYAWDGVFNNIGADGGKAQGASSGVVIASPSQSNPNCEFDTQILASKQLAEASHQTSTLGPVTQP